MMMQLSGASLLHNPIVVWWLIRIEMLYCKKQYKDNEENVVQK